MIWGSHVRRATYRLFSASAIIALALVGFGTKAYRGPLETWFHNYAGGIVYEIFWIVLFGALLPQVRPWRIALSVFVVTCGLETMQLWHHPLLESIRSNFFGRALIGDGFDPLDFVYYVAGSVIGWVAWRALRFRGAACQISLTKKERNLL